MHRRVRDRRRALGRQRSRKRGGLLLIAVLVLAAVGAFLWLRSSDVFAVERITATATRRITEEELALATSEALGVSLLKLSTSDVEEALLALPYARSVEVYREFPNTLEIRLEEYEPVARLKGLEDGIWLVAEDGRILEKVKPPRGVNLPLVVYSAAISPVVGEQVSGAIADSLPIVALLLDEETSGGLPTVKEVTVSAAGELVLGLEGGADLRLGRPTQLEQKLKVASQIIQQYSRDGEQVDYVDVTAPERVAVKAD